MTQFYGFNWQQAPQYSRLFNPQVMQQAQSAYGQGMSQFTPYDPQQLEKIKAAQVARSPAPTQAAAPTGNWYVGPDGRMYDTTSGGWANQYLKNNPKSEYARSNPSGVGESVPWFEKMLLASGADGGFKPFMGTK